MTIWFGRGFAGHKRDVKVDELKSFDIFQRAKALKARTDSLFIKQINPFANPKPVWAPFPLAVMTCVGIEMIGAYKYGDAGGDSNRHFRTLVEDMDSSFKKMRLAPDGKMRNVSDFIYFGFRHSLVHGFYGKWVFITHKSAETPRWKYSSKSRSIILNVYWFSDAFRRVYEAYFADLLRCNNASDPVLVKFDETFRRYHGRWL